MELSVNFFTSCSIRVYICAIEGTFTRECIEKRKAEVGYYHEKMAYYFRQNYFWWVGQCHSCTFAFVLMAIFHPSLWEMMASKCCTKREHWGWPLNHRGHAQGDPFVPPHSHTFHSFSRKVLEAHVILPSFYTFSTIHWMPTKDDIH